MSEASAPHEDDVRVAGTDRAAAGAPAGDTLGFRAMPPEPMRTGVSGEEPHDEIASNRRSPHGKGGSGRRNGMRIVAVARSAAVVIGGGAVAAFALTGGSGDSGDSAATVSPTRKVADAAPKVDPKVLEQQRRAALERASRATREDSGRAVHPPQG